MLVQDEIPFHTRIHRAAVGRRAHAFSEILLNSLQMRREGVKCGHRSAGEAFGSRFDGGRGIGGGEGEGARASDLVAGLLDRVCIRGSSLLMG